MKDYHKIDSIYKRDNSGKFTDEYSRPEFALLHDIDWVGTEKVDGTNIKIYWDGSSFEIGGRTKNAKIPSFLYKKLMELFNPELMLRIFGSKGGVTLYGEGYGNKIQKVGSSYIADGVSFILFDIMAEDIFFAREKVEEYASELNIKCVPTVLAGSLDTSINFVKNGFTSYLGNLPAEGLVLRPFVELRDRLGRRIITKIKTKDF